MFHASIFNDVLFPITPGPSSSNTFGPFCIGRVLHEITGETPRFLKIEMAKGGGYDGTFYGMRSDRAFLLGVMGKELESHELESAYDEAKACGLKFDFEFNETVPKIPTESCRISMETSKGMMQVSAASLGGGEIQITEIDGCPVDLDGRTHAIIWKCAGKAHVVKSSEPIGKAQISEIKEQYRPEWIGTVHAIYPFQRREHAEVPFSTGKEMLHYTKEKQIPIWAAACDYESALCHINKAEIRRYCSKLYELTERAIERGYGVTSFDGVTTPKARAVREFFQSDDAIPLGIGSTAAPDALSIMEHSNAHGEIVCMPTGGSSGIIVPAIRYAANALGLNRDREIKALLTAGMIGVFYYPTHYSGDLGCQAEIGVAVSMAAGALASLMTQDPAIIERAAVLGGESLLGLICDPVDGYVQVPCFIRNLNAVSIAATCANSAMAGVESCIVLDEMAEAMLRVGEKIYDINDLGICNFNASLCYNGGNCENK